MVYSHMHKNNQRTTADAYDKLMEEINNINAADEASAA